MDRLIEALAPLQQRITEKSAYLGIIIAVAVFAFSLFLPWASIPSGISARDGGSSSGWSEAGYIALLPFVRLLWGLRAGKKPMQPRPLVWCSLAAFALLGFNNIVGRSTWSRAYDFTAEVFTPGANYGSSLDVGFWLGLLAMIALAACGLAWSLHRSEGVQPASAETATV